MNIVRAGLLWASTSPTMERIVRKTRPMRPLVSKFMPGETRESVLPVVKSLAAGGERAIVTFLGENVTTDKAAAAVEAEYERLIAMLAEANVHAHISVKLTQLGWDVNQDQALNRVRRLTAMADAQRMMLVMDMEYSSYVESTIAAYESLARDHTNVGIAIQAYLHRTPTDVQRLLAIKPYIRLVKGAYREPSNIALQGRSDIDEAYRKLALAILAAAPQGARLVLGTHDIALVRRVRTAAGELGVAGPLESQMLYGIQETGRRAMKAEGIPTRVLISYGEAWYPWFMRRLAEKPSNLMMIARNIVS